MIPELFHNLTQKKKKGLTNGNFEEDSHVSCVSMKDEREEIENKLLNEEIIQYYCCYHWCGLIPRHFHYLTKKKKKHPDLQIAILKNIHRFLVFL